MTVNLKLKWNVDSNFHPLIELKLYPVLQSLLAYLACEAIRMKNFSLLNNLFSCEDFAMTPPTSLSIFSFHSLWIWIGYRRVLIKLFLVTFVTIDVIVTTNDNVSKRGDQWFRAWITCETVSVVWVTLGLESFRLKYCTLTSDTVILKISQIGNMR